MQRGQKVEETASVGSGVAAGKAALDSVLSSRLVKGQALLHFIWYVAGIK